MTESQRDAIHRSSAHLLREADPATRAQLLALESARFGRPELAADQPGGRWTVRWATGRRVDQRLVQVLRGSGVQPVLGELDGRPVIVGEEWWPENRVRARDALTGATVSAFAAERDARVVAADLGRRDRP